MRDQRPLPLQKQDAGCALKPVRTDTDSTLQPHVAIADHSHLH
ncbi:hypothetical protein Fraau_2199 [Frateuria aurantia DSM 6220]|uniref:Uncharacterized protein n=1 Tax=Frateuria aurantia (strain ATCC 33424 / DSM 6220 / KCTC 2777 / LMG 1558 / NBRC 3245 / NCIMB 13370) TaxID=767434 RepID=H8L4M6_FRAAD|nr:hypothetical protein Fraau_2199 [Frateuria aurantia DSM 6220]